VALSFLALIPRFIDPGSEARALAFLVLGLTIVSRRGRGPLPH
jgi:threonine/homoserine/homoserine lactone efflux protein